MITEEIKKQIQELFITQNLAVLSTHDAGQPYASLIAFVGKPDLKDIFFATPRATRKYANLKADPRVAILINNSENKTTDFHRAISVTATGTAQEVAESDRNEFVKAYLSKHSHLKDFIHSPSTAWIRVTIDRYYLVKHFQKVIQLHVNR